LNLPPTPAMPGSTCSSRCSRPSGFSWPHRPGPAGTSHTSTPRPPPPPKLASMSSGSPSAAVSAMPRNSRPRRQTFGGSALGLGPPTPPQRCRLPG
jgi:hypothetical protein